MPDCFKSCAFYRPRGDLKCRRFENGFQAVSASRSANLVEIEFGKWAQLEGIGPTALLGRTAYKTLERTDALLSWATRHLPMPYYIRARSERLYGVLQAMAGRLDPFATPVTSNASFLAEVYNPNPQPITFRFSFGQIGNAPDFMTVLTFEPGYNVSLVPSAEIFGKAPIIPSIQIKAAPVDGDQGIRMVFGELGFVELSESHALADVKRPAVDVVAEPSTKKIKCVVWDLDNTLWNGVLIEDGLAGIKLRSEVVDVIKALDQRGIVNSIASKNYAEEAEAALKSFGLDMFVFAQIGWGPKSQSIRAIQQAMNVGMDTIAFVDDQPFERAEVTSACSEVEAFDIDAIAGLLDHPRFDVPVTGDSALRRKRYQEQAARNIVQEQSDDYLGFLKSCEISVDLAKLSQDMVPRAHELAQRTNQMNFSGNRYTIKEIETLNTSDDAECWTIAAADRFGSYGIVGLAVIERERNQIIDLMMSCRIQKKMVDHAVLCEFLRRYHRPDQPLTIKYRPTERNRNAAGLFTELGFEKKPLDEETTLLSFPAASPLPTNDIVTLERGH